MPTNGGGQALFRLVRYWSRRWPRQAGPGDDDAQVGHILILEAIAASEREGVAAIADAAAELGLDRSNASRMLSDAVAAGLVAKTAAPGDNRRAEVRITESGRALLGAARRWQEETFARLTADWPEAEAGQLAAYLVRLAEQQITPTKEQL
ncbi:MAG TPA: MarR family winged helix-turn-helix transcriptional regulator [Acidimicrobiales bacterium]|nr:MarR family winged helix-turn-helix transcriptional regulator [Acidimicrobiales bacterium]